MGCRVSAVSSKCWTSPRARLGLRLLVGTSRVQKRQLVGCGGLGGLGAGPERHGRGRHSPPPQESPRAQGSAAPDPETRGRGPSCRPRPSPATAAGSPGQQHPQAAPLRRVPAVWTAAAEERGGLRGKPSCRPPGRRGGTGKEPVSWLGRLTSAWARGGTTSKTLCWQPPLGAPSTWGADPGVHMLTGACPAGGLSCRGAGPEAVGLGPLHLPAPRWGLGAPRAVLLPKAWGLPGL